MLSEPPEGYLLPAGGPADLSPLLKASLFSETSRREGSEEAGGDRGQEERDGGETGQVGGGKVLCPFSPFSNTFP